MSKTFNWFKLNEQEYKILVECAWLYSYEYYLSLNIKTPVSEEQFKLFAKILSLQFEQDRRRS